jgi:hypothetical protein
LTPVAERAGWQPAAAEEIPAEEPPPSTAKAAPVEAKQEQVDEIRRLIARLAELRPDTDWKKRGREITGGPPELMTVTIANVLIERLRQTIEAAEGFDNYE